MRLYDLLKDEGHSPAKAAEIVLDAKRGCEHALRWAKVVARGRKVEELEI